MTAARRGMFAVLCLLAVRSAAAQPAPDAAQPAPDVAQSAPDAAQPAPDAAQPAPDAAQPAPATPEVTAAAAAPQPAPDLGRRLAIGMQFGALDRPAGHLGIPLDGNGKMGAHLSFSFVGRYQLDDRTALAAGLGLPSGAMGFAVWTGYEVSLPIVRRGPGIAAIEVYEASGLQFGFAGPDYFARHDNEYVGFGYGYNPPYAFAVRLPVGLRVRWRGDRLDTHIEGTEILALTPSVESNFELSVGASLHFR